MNPLRQLRPSGQSVWLDYIDRDLLTSGKLSRLIEEDDLRGVTSNPTIFDKALSGSDSYDKQIREILAEDSDTATIELYERLAVSDIQAAADILRPVYDESAGGDGYVSLEVSPHLANNTKNTIAEAKRLWGLVDRPNLMIKVPATPEGIPAIESLISDGYNINVTLMFSITDYETVAQAYLRGIERLADPGKVASVASFFVSRVDGKVDQALEQIGTTEALSLRGKIAVANSKRVYRRFQEIFDENLLIRLRQKGARSQRVLWGSTSTKNPDYPDVLYVETLIGADTVNTMPPATIDAFRDHGTVSRTVDRDLDEADAQLARLAELGVDLDNITEQPQAEGVKAFADSFDHLLKTIDSERRAIIEAQTASQS